MNEVPGTPADKPNIANADTVRLPKETQSAQKVRTLQDIINELNDTYFFSPRRYQLKKEFLAQLRDSTITGNVTLLQDFVLDALFKYVSASDRQDILRMKRTDDQSALPFAVAHRIHDLQKIKRLVEEFKLPVDPAWISLREDPAIKLYLQQHTALYAAAEKKDLEAFKITLKTQDAKLAEYHDQSIVDFIQSKIRENQHRNVVVRYFLNQKWNRMLRTVTGHIKKKLLTQAKKENAISAELLALLNQCPPEEIYFALLWYDHDNFRLYDKFKILELTKYSNIHSQIEQITSKEEHFGVTVRSRVPSSLKIVSHVGGPVAKAKQEDAEVVLDNQTRNHGKSKEDLQDQNPSHNVRRSLSFTQ